MNRTSLTPKDEALSSAISLWNHNNLEEAVAGWWFGRLFHAVNRLVTDTRQIEPGAIFIALKGTQFDGHQFVKEAAAKGAVAAIVEHADETIDFPQLVVDNTLRALGRLAAYHRRRFKNVKVAALTGSSGKTTTKEMLGSILAAKAPTLVTRGNLNNEIGVPLMLLELMQKHVFAVLELGANHLGEIQYTTMLTQPMVAGVLNIGTAHMGEFGGRKAIARAKAEIFLGLPNHGIAILPKEDAYYDYLNTHAAAHKPIRFGQEGDIFASDVALGPQSSQFVLNTPLGKIDIQLPFAGQHNVTNALAAAAFALAMGCSLEDIKAGLSQAYGAKGRLEFKSFGSHLLIDDTYNANPNSVLAAAEVLLKQQGLKILVLGDIAELGDAAQNEHLKLGQALAHLPIDRLIAVGQYAPYLKEGWDQSAPQKVQQAVAYSSKEQAVQDLKQQLQSHPKLAILFKGSRAAAMESVIQSLMESGN